MVIVIMRLIQKIANGKWEELEELDKKFNELGIIIPFPQRDLHIYQQ